jgi:hypothetical protein
MRGHLLKPLKYRVINTALVLEGSSIENWLTDALVAAPRDRKDDSSALVKVSEVSTILINLAL